MDCDAGACAFGWPGGGKARVGKEMGIVGEGGEVGGEVFEGCVWGEGDGGD